MNKFNKTQKRWMASILWTSTEPLADAPFKRGSRGGAAARLLDPAPRVSHSS